MKKDLLLSDFKKTEPQKFDKGVLEFKVEKWEKFIEVADVFKDNTQYLWRGQSQDYPLLASFYRNDEINKKHRETGIEKLFKDLKEKLWDVNKKNFTDDEIWAIGQHYGLKTPFLDWTKNPKIAAYFSFYKKFNEDEEDSVIYAFNKTVRRLNIKKENKNKEIILDEKCVEIIKIEPGSLDNLDEVQNKRLEAQEGIFTKMLNIEGFNIESVVKNFWRKKPEYINNVFLVKIFIKAKCKEEYLEELNKVNITHGKLFPDYFGAVEKCKLDLSLNKE